MPQTPPADLIELAHAHRVATEYNGFDGELKVVSAATLIKVLSALDVPCASATEVKMSLAKCRDEQWRSTLPPAVVVRHGSTAEIPVNVRDGAPVEVWVNINGAETKPPIRPRRWGLSQIDRYVEPRVVDGRMTGRATFAVPGDLPEGWHSLHAVSDDFEAVSTLVVTPTRMNMPASIADDQVWGMLVQLYSVRSADSWGVGDFADLADIAYLCASLGGADFVAVNPLSAAEPIAPMTASPYQPSSRRYLNPIYIRVEDIPETAYLTAADRSLVQWAAEPVRELNTDPGPIDRDAVWAAKSSALEVLFKAPRRLARQAAFDDFKAEQGPGLEHFALWSAITEHLDGKPWPEEYATPDSPGVRALKETLADRVEFYMWLQWVADQQKAAAQRVATDAGMRIGIMHDLAVGVSQKGADAWAFRQYLAQGVEVGAPPDMYNQLGQNWELPPWNPRALAKAGYKPYRDLIRTLLRHAGSLRVDHILGLFRLWWIPKGDGGKMGDPATGTYVYYDHEALVGILCLEAQRAGSVVVGEDLGTFEPWVLEYLRDYGLLGTSILWFENNEDGTPKRPEQYRHLAMASVGTHDMPPTAGYLAGEHVDLGESLGLLVEPVEVVREREAAHRDKMIAFLVEQGVVAEDASERELIEGMHRYLRKTPAALIGVQLVDAVGERRAQNQPGTDKEYPNWKIPLNDSSGNVALLEDAFESQRLRSLIAVMNEDLGSA